MSTPDKSFPRWFRGNFTNCIWRADSNENVAFIECGGAKEEPSYHNFSSLMKLQYITEITPLEAAEILKEKE